MFQSTEVAMREFTHPSNIERLEQLHNHRWIKLEFIKRRKQKKLDEAKVNAIVQHIDSDGYCLPIIVSKLDDTHYRIIGDGRHRYEAHVRAGNKFIFCRII